MTERIWAPWRLSYIEGSAAEGCIFEQVLALGDDREGLVLHRGEAAFVMLNAFPYTNGHVMIAPYRHTADLSELGDEELLEVNRLVRDSVSWITLAYRPEGFNIGVNLGRVAGAGIPSHVHWHVVPRWGGDTNFMTTVGDARVLPQSLLDSYDRLKAIVGP